MEDKLKKIFDVLTQLVGLHRQLLEFIRVERLHLAAADVQGIQLVADQKYHLVQEIHRVETLRMKLLAELVVESKLSLRELTLAQLILVLEADDPKLAQQFSSLRSTLLVLTQRISDQNQENLALIERSLGNIEAMKSNLFASQNSHSETYSQQGQKVSTSSPHRILSQEV